MSAPMDLRIEFELARLRETRRQLLRLAEAVLAPQRAVQPRPSSWSVQEVVEHLLIVEEQIVGLLRKNVEKLGELAPVSRLAKIRVKLMNLVVLSRIRVKAPMPEILPKGGVLLEESVVRFEAVDRGWDELLPKFLQQGVRAAVFKHPFFGWFSILETLKFLRLHLRHHQKQIERIKGSLLN